MSGYPADTLDPERCDRDAVAAGDNDPYVSV